MTRLVLSLKIDFKLFCFSPPCQLAKLKRSYEKLQRKYQKEAREGAKSRDDKNEVSRLNEKLEVTFWSAACRL